MFVLIVLVSNLILSKVPTPVTFKLLIVAWLVTVRLSSSADITSIVEIVAIPETFKLSSSV